MNVTAIFWLLLLLPTACAGLCLLLRSARAIMMVVGAGALCQAALGATAAVRVLRSGQPLLSPGGWFNLDALSAFHLLVMMAVFTLSSLFAWGYFHEEMSEGQFRLRLARRFGSLWFGSMAAMTLVLISNNLGILWVGIEATTLLTAFLICIHRSAASLEAMWKYLIICSVGVAFAFMGTLLVAASTAGVLPSDEALLWTRLVASAGQLNPMMLKAGFLFLLVGYGTKAGLAPMHTWLPDAHSQAPAPVSALFSGFLLNSSLYCILRYLPIMEGGAGMAGWSLRLLLLFGLVSLLVAAVFIYFQRDVKRLLAYSTVEHIGIIAIGVGLGGAGAAAAMFHMLNHSIAKSVAFFGAGRVGQLYETHEIGRIQGMLRSCPTWGGALFAGVLALIGAAPFAIFMSEFQVLKAAADGHSWWTLGLFLGGAGMVFMGALRHLIAMAWGDPSTTRTQSVGWVEGAIAVAPVLALLALGLWMPQPLQDAVRQAAAVIAGAKP